MDEQTKHFVEKVLEAKTAQKQPTNHPNPFVLCLCISASMAIGYGIHWAGVTLGYELSKPAVHVHPTPAAIELKPKYDVHVSQPIRERVVVRPEVQAHVRTPANRAPVLMTDNVSKTEKEPIVHEEESSIQEKPVPVQKEDPVAAKPEKAPNGYP